MQQACVSGTLIRAIAFTRVMDMNDRALRNITIGLGGKGERRAARGSLHDHRSVRGYGYPAVWPLIWMTLKKRFR